MQASFVPHLALAILFSLTLACGGGGSGGSSDSGNTPGAGTPTPPPGGNNTPPPSNSAPDFGQPSDAQIRPGVLISAAGSQCTSNFIYVDNNGDFYIGAAAHCFSPDANSGVDPCEAQNEALGLEVEIENAAFTGSLVYSSWQVMKDAGIPAGSDICIGNDFALIQIDPRDYDNLHPAARVFGGPTSLFSGDASQDDNVFTYGQSPFSLGFEDIQAKQGTIESQSDDGWIYFVTLESPGAPGDSGSAVLHESGKALGVLSTLNTCIGLCSPSSNGVVNLEMALDYANTNGLGSSVSLVTWSEFSP